MYAIVTEALSKQYSQGKLAVNGVSIAIGQGAVFGFLGPNGAGKTTMVKLLCGMLAPTGGSCRVFDLEPPKVPEQVHAISGVVTEHAQMYDYMTGIDNLIFYGAAFGMDPGQCRQRANSLLETLSLAPAAGQKLATYSTGMRQRLSLARAMLHRPRVLFLDEPTSGLDPESAQDVNRMIKRLAIEEGITVFLCTHQLRYAQEVCTHYGLIDDGVLLAGGDFDTLRAMVSRGLTVSIHAGNVPPDIPRIERTAEGWYAARVQSQEEIPAIVRGIVQGGGDVYHVSADEITLEDIYFALIEKRKEAQRSGAGTNNETEVAR